VVQTGKPVNYLVLVIHFGQPIAARHL